MKPIDYTPILQVLYDFLSKNGWAHIGLQVDSDFYYYYEEEKTGFSLIVAERSARLFPQFAYDNGLEYEVPIFILAFLHELGHYVTLGDFTEEELEQFENEKENLGDTDEDFLKYFAIPDEFAATFWAIEYINDHPDIIYQLDIDLAKAFDKFFEINEISA